MRHRINVCFLFVLILAVASNLSMALAEETAPPDLIVLAGRLIDGTGALPKENVALLISEGRITAIVPLAEQPTATPAPVIDALDATVLPGFINAYTHVLDEVASFGSAWTKGGVTTVADMATPLAVIHPFRWFFSQPVSPHLVIAGPTISAPQGYPALVLGPDFVIPVQGTEDAQKKVEQLVNDFQADVIHITVSSAIPELPQLTDGEIQAIVKAAHSQGRKVLAYVDRPGDITTALAGGVDGLAHLPFEPIPDQTLQAIVDAGVIVVPILGLTYDVLRSEADKASLLENARRLHALGGTFAVGDRSGLPEVRPGFPAREVDLLQSQVGLSPKGIIEALTRNSAAALGVHHMIGTLVPGSMADMVVVAGNPLYDVTALQNVVTVIKGGFVAHTIAKGNRQGPVISLSSLGSESQVIKGLLPLDLEVRLGSGRTLGSLAVDIDHKLVFYDTITPDPNTIVISTQDLQDGWHTLGVTAIDSANSVSRSMFSFRTDNWKSLLDSIDAPIENSWFGTIDLSRAKVASAGWEYASEPELLFNDKGRRIKTTQDPEFLVWETPFLHSFSVKVMAAANLAVPIVDLVEVSTSFDNKAWLKTPYTEVILQESSTGWRLLELNGVSGHEAHFLKVTFAGDAPVRALQLSEVEFVMANP